MSENNEHLFYIPDIVPLRDTAFIKHFNAFFSYKIIHLQLTDNIDYIRDIIELNKCPNRPHKLFFSNLFNRYNNCSVTLLRICHACKEMFVISGSYRTRFKYDKAFNFFDNQLNNQKK